MITISIIIIILVSVLGNKNKKTETLWNNLCGSNSEEDELKCILVLNDYLQRNNIIYDFEVLDIRHNKVEITLIRVIKGNQLRTNTKWIPRNIGNIHIFSEKLDVMNPFKELYHTQKNKIVKILSLVRNTSKKLTNS